MTRDELEREVSIAICNAPWRVGSGPEVCVDMARAAIAIVLKRAADRLTGTAEFLRADSQKTLDDWTGADIPEEDRVSNRRFAREQRDRAAVYDTAATAILSLGEQEGRENG